jgi:hypothetical protein
MQVLFQSLRKIFSVIFPTSKGSGKCKIAVYREVNINSGNYRFGFTIESES